MTVSQEIAAVILALVSGGGFQWSADQLMQWRRRKASGSDTVQAARIGADVQLREALDAQALAQIDRLTKGADARDATILKLENDFHEVRDRHDKEIEEIKDGHARALAALQGRLDEAERKIEVLEQVNGELTAQKDKDDRTIAEKQATIEDLRDLVKRLQNEKDQLVGEKQASEDECQRRIDALNKRIDALENASR